MKAFLKDNPTIAFGLGLPLILVVVFLLISGIPKLLIASPQYDLLFATGYNNYQSGLQISVINQSVQVTHQGDPQRNQKPRIWRYYAKNGAIQEIAYLFPPSTIHSESSSASADEVGITTIAIPDLNGLTVDSSSIAPDGYEFSVGNRYSGNAFGGLFYSSRYRHDAVLSKNGRSILLPDSVGRYYLGNTHFIGWVVSP